MKVETIPTEEAPEQGQWTNSTDELPAHLAFRQIVVHEFSGGAEQPLRLHFHYREHSKHIRRPAA